MDSIRELPPDDVPPASRSEAIREGPGRLRPAGDWFTPDIRLDENARLAQRLGNAALVLAILPFADIFTFCLMSDPLALVLRFASLLAIVVGLTSVLLRPNSAGGMAVGLGMFWIGIYGSLLRP